MAFFRKRGKTWYYTIEIGTGKNRKRVERAGGRTKADAEKARAAALAQYGQTGVFHEAPDMTVREFFTEWEQEDLATARQNTRELYHTVAKNHVFPEIGDRKLASIRPRTLQALMNRQAQTVSTSMLSNLHAVLSRAFSYAVFCEYLMSSPMQGVKTPASQVESTPRTVFTPEQLEETFQHFRGTPILLLIQIGYYTGARLGEIQALTWDDIDFTAKTLTISKTVIHGGTLQRAPKTASSVRTIVIGDKLVRILRAARKAQAEDRLRYGKAYIDCGRVVRRPDGRPVRSYNTIYKFFHTLGPGLCFHSLRHTHATMLLEAGEDLELVSKRLGHTSISITARFYSHILAARQQSERALLDRVL